jgi:hypothetical protein
MFLLLQNILKPKTLEIQGFFFFGISGNKEKQQKVKEIPHL